jgi:hypothetical protein
MQISPDTKIIFLNNFFLKLIFTAKTTKPKKNHAQIDNCLTMIQKVAKNSKMFIVAIDQ